MAFDPLTQTPSEMAGVRVNEDSAPTPALRQPMLIKVRRACGDDAGELAPRLRAADLQEIEAAIGEDPLIVLERSIAWSDPCYAVVCEGDKPIALFGTVPEADDKNVGIVWLLASPELTRHTFFFLRNSRRWVERLHERYKVLWNCVDARNETHIKWLRWCDFTFLRRVEEYGVERRPFYEFTRARDDSP